MKCQKFTIYDTTDRLAKEREVKKGARMKKFVTKCMKFKWIEMENSLPFLFGCLFTRATLLYILFFALFRVHAKVVCETKVEISSEIEKMALEMAKGQAAR